VKRQHSFRELPLAAILGGGDRRSIGKSDQVAAQILRQPNRFPELIESLWDDNAVVRMRAADAAEKISQREPNLLVPFKAELLGLAEETDQAELRWHLAAMLPRLPLTARERGRAVTTLRNYLEDHSSIVKTFAIQGLADLAKGNVNLESEMTDLLQQCCRTGTPAMKARSRRLLRQFEKT